MAADEPKFEDLDRPLEPAPRAGARSTGSAPPRNGREGPRETFGLPGDFGADDDFDFREGFGARERPRSPTEALEPALAPEPPLRTERRPLHPAIRIMNGLMSLILLLLLGAGGLFYYAKLQFDRPGPLDHSEVIAIPRGAGVNAIAERLEKEGIISDRRIFVASVIYFKAQNKLKAGEYEIRKQASMRQVLDTLVEGRAILYGVTIPEGYTSQQVLEVLNRHEMLEGVVPEVPEEGSLLPDTYRFSRGTSRMELIERMQAEQREFIARIWDKRAEGLPFKSPREAVILASIVEKETGRAEERARIAGVFINRLRKNMRLQSDPTIIYGLVGGEGSLGRPILRSEIDRPTPYNTYHINGLPPTPIANPGRAAIEAVLRPAKTQDLYFVADGTGGHIFSPTLSAHNTAVARWREIERERREKEEAEEEAKRLAAAKDAEAASAGGALSLRLDDTILGASSFAGSSDLPTGSGAAAPDPHASSPGAVPLPLRNPRLR